MRSHCLLLLKLPYSPAIHPLFYYLHSSSSLPSAFSYVLPLSFIHWNMIKTLPIAYLFPVYFSIPCSICALPFPSTPLSFHCVFTSIMQFLIFTFYFEIPNSSSVPRICHLLWCTTENRVESQSIFSNVKTDAYQPYVASAIVLLYADKSWWSLRAGR